MSKTTKTVELKKKDGQKIADYAMTSARISAFRSDKKYDGFGIVTKQMETGDIDYIKFAAAIKNPEGFTVATGHSEEFRSNNTRINKFGALMKCETSAIGRALANLGFMTDGSIASTEDIERNIALAFDYCITILAKEEVIKKSEFQYVQDRLKDTDFSSEQIKEINKQLSAARIANSSKSAGK